ncbi:MAG TPA: hemerythrin domain-containing protein, partial [Ferruginibacter sp.]|nr:hemerythrin domain-containing protein [Ferruginibacter sp.]
EVATEMSAHMQKEEMILFPRIKEIETLASIHQHRNLDARYVTAPIQVMEAEHDAAGELMYRIRELTGNYTAPEEACTTFRISLAELKEFEEDLHRHVHIENNILFPLAEKLFEQQAA